MQDLSVVLFYGPPGSGKGTQVAILADKTGFDILDAGHTFREFVKNYPENPVAKRMQHRMEQGKPIYTEDYFYILQSTIHNQLKTGKPIIFDKPGGSLLEEAEWFNNLILIGKIKTVLFHLPISLEESLRRIANRWFVEGEQLGYPTKQEALSRVGGDTSRVFQRGDDALVETITKRYNFLYKDNFEAILNILKQNPYIKLVDVPGDLSIEQTHQFILNNL